MDNETQKSPDVEQRLSVLEKTEKAMADNLKWGVDVLKWGLGVFAAVAISFAGFNSYTANRNYERDKGAFEKQFVLLTQQFSTDNDKQITELRKQSESSFLYLSNSFLSLSNGFQTQFTSLHDNYFQRLSNLWGVVTSNNMAIMRTIASNNDVRFNALVTNVNVTFSNRDVNIYRDMNDALGRMQTNVNEHMAMALGEGLMLRGSVTMGGPKAPKGDALASAAYSYMAACQHLYQAHDEVNLQRCLSALTGNCLPQLVNKNSKTKLTLLITQHELLDILKLLIADLKAGNINRRYVDSIRELEMYLQIFEGKMSVKVT